MTIKPRHVIILLISALISLGIWYRYSYPQLAIINFSIDRHTAVKIAENYLKTQSADPQEWKHASVLEFEGQTDRFLQKTIGFSRLKNFISQYDYDLFVWVIRFFKENVKEEYRVIVSTATGQVIAYKHTINENAERKSTTREEALLKATAFLENNFHLNLKDYSLKMDTKSTLDHRVEYSFGWQHKTVDIPWNQDPDGGKGRLSTTVTLAGDEILTFAKNNFNIPEDFNRSLEASRNIANNISTPIRLIYSLLFAAAIFYIISRRNHLAMHTTKSFYIGIAVSIFIFNILADLNEFQTVIFGYNTTSPFHDQFWRYWIDTIRSTAFVSISIIVPALAGELLYFETSRQKREGTLLHFIHSSLLTQKTAQLILLGYFTCIIMLGLQSVLLHFGQKYLGVWTEYSWANNLSTSYFPFISAFIAGFNASIFEEFFYRVYLISLGKKIFKWTSIAVIFSSIFWGFSHTNYPVYPMWFRGIEVSILGFFMAGIYLNFGIIPVLIAHFLFNAFWNSAGFLLGTTQPFYFYSTLIILLLPALWGLAAFIQNKHAQEKPMDWHLTKAQLFNLDILISYLKQHPELAAQDKAVLIKKISSKGWDIAVVEKAVENVFGNAKKS